MEIKITIQNERYKAYDKWLDSLYEDRGNPFPFPASRIIKEIDPTMYEVGFDDYISEKEEKEKKEKEEE